jgi:hypothetical protein
VEGVDHCTYLYDKTDCSNCTGISLLSTTYKMLSNILLSTVTLYTEEIIEDQRGFRRNRPTIVHILCIPQILKKKWKYNEAVRRKDLYNSLIEFGIFTKLVWLIKMCLNETYSRIQVGKHLSD